MVLDMKKIFGPDTTFLIGWQAMADYIGIHPRTLKRWHYRYLKIPFFKTRNSMQGRVMISSCVFDLWLQSFQEGITRIRH